MFVSSVCIFLMGMCVIHACMVHTRVGVCSPVQSQKKDVPHLRLLSSALDFEIGSCYVVQAGFTFAAILLP